MKKLFKTITSFLIVLVSIILINFVIAMSRPSSPSTDVTTPIYSGSTGPGANNQTKNAGLTVQKGFIVGNYASNFSFIDSLGKMVVKGSQSLLASRTASTAPNLFVNGVIRLKDLSFTGSGLREVCVDGNGVLVLCNKTEFKNPGIYSWKVPDGVSEVTFEVWGAGGAGYNNGNLPSTGSYDGSDSYVVGGGRTSGGSNYTVNITGKGGKGARSKNQGGSGGTTSYSGSVTVLSTTNGGTGGTGGSQLNISVQNCSGGYYSIVGSNGSSGGSGGTSYNTTGMTGGTGGSSAGNLSCNPQGNWYVSGSYPDPVGSGQAATNPVGIGGGGAGLGGKGGDSTYDTTTTCSNCYGDGGFAGGGGGGYIKAKVSVQPGNVFYINVGEKGYVVGYVYQIYKGMNQGYDYRSSASGGDGAVVITY